MKTAPGPESLLRGLFTELIPAEERQGARFVWLANFEAERFWTLPKTAQLPKLSQSEDVAIVNRLEEMSLLLAEYPDTVILRNHSDQGFLDYLTDLGFHLPQVIAVDPPDQQSSISEAVLAREEPCNRLLQTSKQGNRLFLLPFATTRLEEEIAIRAGLRTIGASAAVCERINSKVYSRIISKELGLPTIRGWECESFEALEEAVKEARTELMSGRKIVLKESMGVSGKGLFVADTEERLTQIMTLLKRKAKTAAHFNFVVERWVEKIKDINYQIFISSTGHITMLAAKQIVTEKGVHMGHRFPPALTQAEMDEYQRAGEMVGKRLFRDGYVGVVGIDSIIDSENKIYPVLEINARFNMSTYQLGLDRLIIPGAKAVAKHYPLVLKQKLSFGRLTDSIGTDLMRRDRAPFGVLIQNFATVNVNESSSGDQFKGRLYVLLIGKDDSEVEQLDRRMNETVSRLQGDT